MTIQPFPPDLHHALQQAGIDTRLDPATRLLYSTDASIYQVEPLGVAFPRTADELSAAVELAAAHGVAVLARGAGTSLGGQAIGPALILDCSRHLNRILAIDPERRTATAEPGVVLNALNRAAAKHGLTFGPDPASSERATLGGSLANNATGSHSILYGMAADHLRELEVILADGSQAVLGEVDLAEAERRAGTAQNGGAGKPTEAALYRAALSIRERYAEAIRRQWPRTWRRASGYNLNYLLPWSAAAPPLWSGGSAYPPVPEGNLNLAPLIAGSEGTLAVIRRATVGLVPLPAKTVLAVLCFDGIADACDSVPEILEHRPSAVELIPQELIRLARSVPAYAAQVAFIDEVIPGGDPAAVLAVEFAGEAAAQLRQQALALTGIGKRAPWLAETAAAQRQVWGVRKVGLGILMSQFGDVKPLAFIEDLAVPVERLGEFIREMERMLKAHGTRGEIYAHASAGCLHIRPLLSLKTVQGVEQLRQIATEAVALTLRAGGSVSGEHGDGLARTEWLEAMYGTEILGAFRELKAAADPCNLLNPGKIVGPKAGPPPKMDANLRFGPDYRTKPWRTVMDFTGQAGLDGAIEQCNGAGVCRKAEGVMCPSFQATQDEMHSTRGRANLLRAMISGRLQGMGLDEKSVYEALDLCLACKGCKAECPSTVDMAKLKYEFLQYYYRQPGNRRLWRDYLFAYIGPLARLGRPFAGLANPVLRSALGHGLAEKLFGLARQRTFPQFAARPLSARMKGRSTNGTDFTEEVLLLSDAFTEFFYPEAGEAAVRLLEAAGCRVRLLPVLGAGRTLMSKGFMEQGQRHARQLVEAIEKLDPEGRMAVVGVEPSEIYTLRDEYLDLLPGDERARSLARRAWMVDEFLVRPGREGTVRIGKAVERRGTLEGNGGRKVLLHGHCYQKARPPADDGYPVGVGATVAMLEAAGYSIQVIDSGCCGMAGAFGYEAEHFEVSQQVGELKLLPAVRAAAPEVIVAAAGISCQAQIEEGARRKTVHPVQLV